MTIPATELLIIGSTNRTHCILTMDVKVYGISNRRELEIHEKDVHIRDTKSDKTVKIPLNVWTMLSRKFPKIEKALDNAKFSSYFAHLDNGWSVSVRKPNAFN